MNERLDHRLDIGGAVATITLERPAAYNAVTRAQLRSLARTLLEVTGDAAVRAIVVTGAGHAFCAGAALDDPEILGAIGQADIGAALVEDFNPVIQALLTSEKPVVAAVNGVAAGAGFGLALACDFRVVSQTAVFTTAFVKIGLVPDCGVSFLLPRMVGYGRAMELCMLSEKVDAAAAQALGLVTDLVPFEHVLTRAQALAAQLAAGPRALGLIKRELARNGLGDIASALRYEAELQNIAGTTADAREGVTAFKEKRPPVFAGR